MLPNRYLLLGDLDHIGINSLCVFSMYLLAGPPITSFWVGTLDNSLPLSADISSPLSNARSTICSITPGSGCSFLDIVFTSIIAHSLGSSGSPIMSQPPVVEEALATGRVVGGVSTVTVLGLGTLPITVTK